MDEKKIGVVAGEAVGVTKMSVNQICGKRVMGDICVILGKANGIKTGEDANGTPWTAITGVFEGTNLQTGAKYRSGKLFLPAGSQEAVEAAVKSLPGFADGKTVGAVKFSIGFRRVEAENPIGYSYETVNLLPVETQTDDLADLIAASREKVPSLAAPPVKQIAAPEMPAAPPATASAATEAPKGKGDKKKAS